MNSVWVGKPRRHGEHGSAAADTEIYFEICNLVVSKARLINGSGRILSETRFVVAKNEQRRLR